MAERGQIGGKAKRSESGSKECVLIGTDCGEQLGSGRGVVVGGLAAVAGARLPGVKQQLDKAARGNSAGGHGRGGDSESAMRRKRHAVQSE
jgi:hypothetical protein